jgi:Glycosyltransferases, probably involved in cell wall biogenesis
MVSGPKVSIITPTYNHDRFIAQCIESVLGQTYSSWEQIVIDDGSTDSTAEVVARYDDERITFIRQENQGIWHLGKTYNDALKRSKGQFIAILEGDDFWPPYKLERQIKAFEKNSVVLSWGYGALTDSVGNITSYRPDDISPYLGISRHDMLRELLFYNPITACTAICRKSALIAIGGFNQPRYVPYLDRPTWLELGLKGDFQAIDEVLGYYRMHDRQVTSTMRLAMFKANRHTAEFYRGLIPEERAAIAGQGCEPRELDSRLADYYYYFGRACLIEENWSGARENFLKAMASKSPKTKAKAEAGMICALCRKNLEWLAEMLKEPRMDNP